MAERELSAEEKAKIVVETEKIKKEMELIDLQKKKVTAEHENFKLSNEDLKRSLEDEDLEQERVGIYTFDQEVDKSSVRNAIRKLDEMSRRDPGSDIKIVLNSPGGSVFHGLALYDFIQELRERGHFITIANIGMGASMGGILLQAGDKRVMGENCYMLIHEVSSVGWGKQSEMEDEVKFTKRLCKRLLNILAERSTLSARQIDVRWKRKDWWLDADESLELGFIDEIATHGVWKKAGKSK